MTNSHPCLAVTMIDQNILGEFPLMVKQAAAPQKLITAIMERAGSVGPTGQGKVTRAEVKKLIIRLYFGGDVAGWEGMKKLPQGAVGLIEQVTRGLRAELKKFTEHVIGDPRKCTEWAMIKGRKKIENRETKEKTKVARETARRNMHNSVIAITLQHQEARIMDEIVQSVESANKGTCCGRIHDEVMFTQVRVEPTKLVNWINKTIREKMQKGATSATVSAITKPAMPLFEMKIVDPTWFNKDAGAMQWCQQRKWNTCGGCGGEVKEGEEPGGKCEGCNRDWITAEKWVKAEHQQKEIDS